MNEEELDKWRQKVSRPLKYVGRSDLGRARPTIGFEWLKRSSDFRRTAPLKTPDRRKRSPKALQSGQWKAVMNCETRDSRKATIETERLNVGDNENVTVRSTTDGGSFADYQTKSVHIGFLPFILKEAELGRVKPMIDFEQLMRDSDF
jgi:hypothetical protein